MPARQTATQPGRPRGSTPGSESRRTNKDATVDGLPGEASPQIARIANRKDADIQEDIRRRVFVRSLCALCSLW